MQNIKLKHFVWIGVLFLISILFFNEYLAVGEGVNLFFLGVVAITGFIFFYNYPIIGLYLICILYPFLNLQLIYGDFNVPWTDIIGSILFGVFLLSLLAQKIKGQWHYNKQDFPALGFFIFFIIAGALSLINVEDNILGSVKYLLRPMAFFYLVYILLPIHYIRDKKVLENCLKIIFGLGVVLGVTSVIPFLFSDLPFQFHRTMPFNFFGLYPMGSSHNLLADTLVAIIPIGLALYWNEKDILKKNWILLLTLMMIGMTLLTFSRAGWLGLATAIITFAILRYNKELKNPRQFNRADQMEAVKFWSVLMLIPLFIFIYAISTSQIGVGSNLNRLKLIDISLNQFANHPIIGSGVGTFLQVVGNIKWYIIEYGAPLDAHGVVFKLLAETGILGLVTFIFLATYLLRLLYKSFWTIKDYELSVWQSGLLASILGIAVFSLFDTSYYLGKTWLFVGLALALMNMATSKRDAGVAPTRQIK